MDSFITFYSFNLVAFLNSLFDFVIYALFNSKYLFTENKSSGSDIGRSVPTPARSRTPPPPPPPPPSKGCLEGPKIDD